MFVAKQQSAFSGFAYDFFDADDSKIGTLHWPDFAEATNARLKNLLPGFLSTKIEINYDGHDYQIVFEYLTRDWNNDVRFVLKDGDAVLASADVVRVKKFFGRHTIMILQPFTGKVSKRSTFFATRYEVIIDGAVIGTLAEKAMLTLKRKLSINLPGSISLPVQFFIFFLVCNHAYR